MHSPPKTDKEQPAGKGRGRPSSRQRILEAASELAHDVGASNISLDAVAERAGISKGGLLYNFPTKLELLQALVARHVELMEAQTLEALMTLRESKQTSRRWIMEMGGKNFLNQSHAL